MTTKCPVCGNPGAPFDHLDCFERAGKDAAKGLLAALTGRDDIASGNVWPEDES